MDKFNLDNTWRSTFQLCPAKYHMMRNLGYKGIYGSTALRAGIVWHKAMEGYYKSIKQDGWESDLNLTAAINFATKSWNEETDKATYFNDFRNMETIGTALLNYIISFSADKEMLSIIEAERKFKIEIDNIRGVKVYFTGKLDLEVNINNVLWILDFKTTGWPIYKLTETLERSNQFMGYQYAAGIEYPEKPEGTMVQILHWRSAKLKAGGYGKLTIEHARVPLIYTREDINRWEEAFVNTAEDIIRCHENNHWVHNYDNCFRYSRCGLWDLCMQEADFEDKELGDNFVIDKPFDVLES